MRTIEYLVMKKKIFLSQNFGPFIRKIRLDLKIGQRELAQKVGIAPSYLNDIEKEKRAAPKIEIIRKISNILKVNNDTLNDLAGISKKSLAPDIREFIEKNPNVVSLIRSIKKNEMGQNQIKKIEDSINKHQSANYCCRTWK